MPFGDYRDFEDCVRSNGDKDDPAAYCASIKAAIEDTVPGMFGLVAHGAHDQDDHGNRGGVRSNPVRFETAYDGVVEEATEDDEALAYSYTGGQHETMNRWLRGSGEASQADRDLEADLDAVIEASPGLLVDTTLFRGVDDQTGPFAVGDIIEDPAFMSTSLDWGPASNFAAAALLEIKAPKGTKGIRGEEVFDEFILGRGTRMRVVEAEVDGSGYRMELL